MVKVRRQKPKAKGGGGVEKSQRQGFVELKKGQPVAPEGGKPGVANVTDPGKRAEILAGKRSSKVEAEKRRLDIKGEAGVEIEREGVERQELVDIEEGKRADLVKVTQMVDGIERTLEVTPEQAALLGGQTEELAGIQARSEGRVPFNELPIHQQILAGTAVLGVSPGAITAVGKLGQVGTRGIAKGAVGAAESFAANGKATAQTASWLTRLGAHLNNPVAVGSLITTIVGSYPFAGFIKEEALQTLSFATLSARNSGDLEGEERALQATNDVLDPTLWDNILSKIPYVNVLASLKDFYEAAREKLRIDAENFRRRREKFDLSEQFPIK